MLLPDGFAALAAAYRPENPSWRRSIPSTVRAISFPMGPTTSRCLGSNGYMPLIETRPNVVFRPTMPQQAAGTRIDPAVSVPKATSASPLARATALPDDDPPGIRILLSGFLGVPKYSFMPEGATANSVMFVLPTIRTLRWRAMARQAASA